MKGGTVQISWHGSDPILSLDFHLLSGLLATAGADRDIKLWSLHHQEKSKSLPSATFKASLSYHSSAVNVVRFSPSGYLEYCRFTYTSTVTNFDREFLASGADGGELLIWRIVQADEDVPTWKVCRTLRFHLKDVLDLDWSPDGTFLLSGSVDNTCIIWNVSKGTAEQVLADHQHYVQGVAWDPAGKYVASLSGDRTCRIYSLRPPTKRSKKKDQRERRSYLCQHVLCKIDSPPVEVQADVGEAPQKQVSSSKKYLFYDENMPSFFRRLAWSPDGSFLVIPAGVDKQTTEGAPLSVSYIVSRNDLSRPILQLPAASKPVVAARFCPIIYSLSPKKSWKHDKSVPDLGVFKLPYRLIYAVATLNSVFIYDTEQSCPIAIFGGLHYAPITDLAWSSDAKFLAVSSQDGYCTLVGFDEGDLGTPMPLSDLPPEISSLSIKGQLENIQESSSALSPLKDVLEKTVDKCEPPDSLQKIPICEKVLGVGNSSTLCSGRSWGKQSDSRSGPQKIRRINPKPISEYLQKSPVSKSDGLDSKQSPMSGARGDQNTAEVPLKQPEVPGQLVGCTVTGDKILEVVQTSAEGSNRDSEQGTSCTCQGGTGDKILKVVQASSEESNRVSEQGTSIASQGIMDDKILVVVQESAEESNRESEQGTSSACQGFDKESSVLQSFLPMDAKTDIHRDTESHRMIEPSIKDRHIVEESAQVRTPPLSKEIFACMEVSSPDLQKPPDQYADIYIRPLKFRRISPKLISDNVETLNTLKPVTPETSLAFLKPINSDTSLALLKPANSETMQA